MRTLFIHGGIDGDELTGSVNVPIYQTSTYRQTSLGVMKGYEYSRTGNPTRHALEVLITELEKGTDGFAFASGMAAITAVLSLFQSGDRVIISNNVYGGTFRVLDKIFQQFGLAYTIVDTSDLKEVETAISDQVKAIFIESPANPLMTITDIRAVSALAKQKGILTIVDNTFMTPYLQRPLELGADIVVHSATKYLGGHSDLIAGLAVTNDKTLSDRLSFIQNATGGILQPFDSWLLIRGIKTLSVRMDRHVENAGYLAEFLKQHPAVDAVYYPGLADTPGYEIHRQQSDGPGAMISFVLNEAYDTETFFSSLEVAALAESLGGVESLVCHPATMTHASIPEEIRKKVGIVDALIRYSPGIEAKEDLIRDLGRALERSKR
ncbi:aminotransferase class V-fold PLP-dependent enzyme [Clostridiales bacterium BAD-6]|uniref:Aminotransferase class V-fold PLP-dependent enzyme n=2 Tax=Sinanaerobacter chloroacetimidivorans TaxID=2818044 RepID=A0A8J7W5U9_9FIRM|nr:aminotransferase class V-fold PLP-dependent enzyme [Sinanaerobacter chloroacetimidivorans]